MAYTGTAFCVTWKGSEYICTAAHVLSEKGGEIHLKSEDNQEIPANIGRVLVDVENDTAIMSVSGLHPNVKRWLLGQANVGDKIVISGFSGDWGRINSEGNILRVSVQTSAAIKSGMSGGLLRSGDRAVGIATNQLFGPNLAGGSMCASLEQVLKKL
jgi:S1-C subfamily serine protease